MRLMGGCLNTNIKILSSSYCRKITVIRIDIKNSNNAKFQQSSNNITITSSLVTQMISTKIRQVSYHFMKKKFMLSEELIKKEKWLHLSDDVLNLSVIKTTLGRWNGTFSKKKHFSYML